ncbi:hypothetical protein ACQ10P_15725, partial [Enterococcus faecalis]|uniref:hypothetical protein n=1 Tax=Enterococcus faecalis TaxID=1351 RepID=UPI003D6A13FE
IKGKVAFLGGPLFFMSGLRKRFVESLAIQPEDVIFPEQAQLFVAMGAALYSEDALECTLEELMQRLVKSQATDLQPSDTLP